MKKRHLVDTSHRPASYVREILRPMTSSEGYDRSMTKSREGIITPEHLERVKNFLQSQCTKDRSEGWHVEQSGIPQSTFSSAKRGKKLGWSTAIRLAEYFGWGDDVTGFLNGTTPAGHYSSLEGRLPVGYPNRGFVLDRLRGVFAAGVLDEVQQIVLPTAVTDWSPAEWAGVVLEKASEWKRLGKDVNPTKDPPSHVGGQEPKQKRRS